METYQVRHEQNHSVSISLHPLFFYTKTKLNLFNISCTVKTPDLTWVIQNGSNIFVKQIHYHRYIYFFQSTRALM